MENFIGCIILESLADQTIMDGVRIDEEKDCVAPNDCEFKVWRQRLVQIPTEDAERFADRLSQAMTENFYAHFFNENELYVVFKDRYFVLPKERDESWQAMIDYGKAVGVDESYTTDIPVVREQLLG